MQFFLGKKTITFYHRNGQAYRGRSICFAKVGVSVSMGERSRDQEAMGRGNDQKSKNAREKNLEKAKAAARGSKRSQLGPSAMP
ncbi:hypothetical protein L1987_60893 [Smallanthus sonchifolius]|uniref:Uncharacterized protein n=1 Tax=Smallanthus sonchifolius TaxID=185202 RepID=A0ACB9D9P8_9ASTR|nr:hypothetical protein L1987_60893 [Smallanthus sonchifolius]